MIPCKVAGNGEGGVGIGRKCGRGRERCGGVFGRKPLRVKVELDSDDTDVVRSCS